jgi:transcriptional regulator with XRE-family HTH domain
MYHNWADLCLKYRRQLGLKQEAAAQDFCVTQSTFSRWEAGLRIPGPGARKQILQSLGLQHRIATKPLQQMALLNGAMPVTVWDRAGCLEAMSERFGREIGRASPVKQPIGRHADEIFENQTLMNHVLNILHPAGFFRGEISAASLIHPPVYNPQRVEMGGAVTVSILPAETNAGDIGMFCIYEHDVLTPAPKSAQLTTVSRNDGTIQHAA